MKKRNFRNFITFLIALGVAGCLGCAQTDARVSPVGQAKKRSPMTVEDVVTLAKAGVSEEVILAEIRAKHASFDLTADQLIQLKSARVSERVIRAMMESPAPQKAPKATAASAPVPGSRSTAPSKKLEAQPAAAAHATVAARTAVPLKSASPPAPVQWVAHNDPMGFSVNVPAGWELHTDPKLGRINIQSSQGQQAIIWPMFIPQQQLDARGAGTVVQQLARRVDAKMTWEAPKLAGNTARVFARGQTSAAALMQWSSAPEGTTIYLFCLSAPSSLYPASVDTFAGIIKSFQVVPGPKANSGAPVKSVAAAEQVSWVRWSDPREGAFNASVPQGWNVSGGAFRQSATDIRQSLVLLSPDRQIRIAVGDANIGTYTMPNRMYARAGMREGGYTSLGDGTKLQIRNFLTAQQFIREYVATSVRRDCGDVQVLSENERQDLAASAAQHAQAQRAPNPRVTAAGVSFSCTWNGREARGYYAAATILPFPGRSGIWYVEDLYGYIASVERQREADDISRHVLNSMGINAQWTQREDQIAGNAVQQDNARSQEIQARARQQIAEDQQKTSDMIVKGYEARSKVYDENARKEENVILGTVDVVDPNTGKQYKIDNVSDYHWMNNQGVIAGTKTYTSPGVDWHEMVTLP